MNFRNQKRLKEQESWPGSGGAIEGVKQRGRGMGRGQGGGVITSDSGSYHSICTGPIAFF